MKTPSECRKWPYLLAYAPWMVTLSSCCGGKASSPGTDDVFGTVPALSGDTPVVGGLFEDSGSAAAPGKNGVSASGPVYVFE